MTAFAGRSYHNFAFLHLFHVPKTSLPAAFKNNIRRCWSADNKLQLFTLSIYRIFPHQCFCLHYSYRREDRRMRWGSGYPEQASSKRCWVWWSRVCVWYFSGAHLLHALVMLELEYWNFQSWAGSETRELFRIKNDDIKNIERKHPRQFFVLFKWYNMMKSFHSSYSG